MINNNNKIFDSLIAEGFISPELGNIVKDRTHHLSALARIGLLASLKAKEDAAILPITRIVVKNNCLYEVKPDGSEMFIKKLPTYLKVVSKKFTLD